MKFIENTTSISELNESMITGIYPNPTNSVLNAEVKENGIIKIVNVLGETVASQVLLLGNNSIDVSTLSNGIYYLQTDQGDSMKFVKE